MLQVFWTRSNWLGAFADRGRASRVSSELTEQLESQEFKLNKTWIVLGVA